MSRSIFVFALLTMLLIVPFSVSAIFTYTITENTCDPPNMDTGASRVIGRGVYFNVTSIDVGDPNATFMLDALLTDATDDRNIIDHETYSINANSSILIMFKNVIDWNQSYFVYVGIKTTGTIYTSTNTQLVTSDGATIIATFSADDTEDDTDVEFGTSENIDFYGFYFYFEPGFHNSGYVPGTPTPGVLGQMVRSYGNSIGVPYFYLIIAFLIAAIISLLPFSIALQYDLNMPNFVYGIFIAVGVTLDFGIGLLDLWMFGMFVLFVCLSVILRYQENIQKLLTHTETNKNVEVATKPLGAITKGLLGVGRQGASGLTARGKAGLLARKLPYYKRERSSIGYSTEKAAAYRMKHRKED
jgi:hypothetical protein